MPFSSDSLALLIALAAPASSQPSTIPARTWDARAVEHLLNRAGFGAQPAEIEAGVAMGQAALVEKLVEKRVEVEPFFVEDLIPPDYREMSDLPQEERRKLQQDFRQRDLGQLNEYTSWWIDRMTSGEDPLRERMVLFWHGLFTSSYDDVPRGTLLIRQNQLVREMALGSYADLLQAMIRDPAMLTYLDNQVNRKGSPNENLARELMELFSLGVGNYTEKDVKEAARALTGRGVSRAGQYEFHVGQHDRGRKTILGATGMFDGDGLVAQILKQDACPRWVAGRLLAYFEGVPPSPERLAEYAAFLRKNEFQIRPFLRKLFLDPAFYRDEVVGARVASPLDYLVGLSRRIGTRPPPSMIAGGASVLGQHLFFPPSVKGWEEGEPWITTASLMQRGNLAGIVVGVVKVRDVIAKDPNVTEAVDETPPMKSMNGESADSSPENSESGRTNTSEPESGAKSDGAKTEGAKQDGAKPEGGSATEAESKKAERKPGAGLAAGRRRGAAQLVQALRRIEASGWRPNPNFTARMRKAGAKTDAAIADRMLDDLLGISAPADTRARMQAFVAKEREKLGARDGALLEQGVEGENVLRRLAHLILSMPEAQLE